MATSTIRNKTMLYVGGQATKTTGNPTTLNSGEIGIFTPSGVRLTEATAATAKEFVIYLKPSSHPTFTTMVSPILRKDSIKRISRKAYVAETEQLDFIGFNGSTGSIQAINSNDYYLTLDFYEGLTSNHGGFYIRQAEYTSDNSATQAEIAYNIASSLVGEFINAAERTVTVNRLVNSAGTATVETYLPRYNSKYVAVSTTPTVAVGDYIRFGAAVTDFAYIVTAVDTTNNIVTLDIPYQGVSATVGAVVDTGSVAADWGIRIEGVVTQFKKGRLHNKKVSWRIQHNGWGTTTFTEAAKASLGNGTERQMKEMEHFTVTDDGDYHTPIEIVHDERALVNGNYDLIVLTYEELWKGFIATDPIKFDIYLAIPETAPNYAVTGTADDITDVLEVLAFGSVTGALSIS